MRLVLIKLIGKLSRDIKQCHLCPFPKRQKHFSWLFAIAHLQVSRSQWLNLHHPLPSILRLSVCFLFNQQRWKLAIRESMEVYQQKHVWCVRRPHKTKVCSHCFRSGPFQLWCSYDAAQHQATSASASPRAGESLGPIFRQPSKEIGLQSQEIVPWSLFLGKDFILFFYCFPVWWLSDIVMASNVMTSWNGVSNTSSTLHDPIS